MPKIPRLDRAALLLLLALPACRSPRAAEASTTTTVWSQPTEVEAACGQCMFEMDAPGCNLAIRVDGKPHFVDGFEMDQLGNAHAPDGMCNAVRHAKVTGHMEGERFVATSFEVLPNP